MDKELVEAAKMFQVQAREASNKFNEEYNSSKMDTMIHRFPPGLREIISRGYKFMVVPTFVAIGPYHHGKEHLEKMEAVKKAAARYLWERSQKLEQAVKNAAAYYYLCQSKGSGENLALDGLDDATKAVVLAVNDARGSYFADETGEGMSVTKDSARFAEMIICDACFLLLYMEAYVRSYGGEEAADDEVNESMRRFLFGNRHRINNDVMLLENQVPWRVIRVLMDLGSDLWLKGSVQHFVAAMASSFKIRESSELELYEWDDEKNPPPHLLALLRLHKIEEPNKSIHRAAEPGGGTASVDDGGDVENALQDPLINRDGTQPPSTSSTATQQAGNRQVVVSAISPRELQEIGIKLTANKTEAISDMGLEEGWLFFSRITLAPLSLSDATASWLVNMAAFEVCSASRFGDPPGNTAVCSYLALLAFFMVRSEDVRKLRSMGLLHGADSDDDTLAFFNTLKKHLPDYGRRFAEVMAGIEEYKHKRRVITTPYRWVYNNWKTVGAVVSIMIATATTIAALINLYKALLSLIHNN
ncbi:UPF0481 protein At3g47200-like isoform X2 [Panicum virgatum]|nr:UPF0481 protein At3g47200-like isoform X2 [Panicum virgatum]